MSDDHFSFLFLLVPFFLYFFFFLSFFLNFRACVGVEGCWIGWARGEGVEMAGSYGDGIMVDLCSVAVV